MTMTLREPPISWSQHLAGTTVVNSYPTSLTAGVAIPGSAHASSRVHVATDYTVGSGTLSLTVGVYGLTTPLSAGGTAGTFLGTSTWVYLGSLNSGASIAADTSKWSQSATRITLAEVFSVSGENYQRIATAIGPPGGVTPVVSTYIGFCTE
jgi:hypothetical protein